MVKLKFISRNKYISNTQAEKMFLLTKPCIDGCNCGEYIIISNKKKYTLYYHFYKAKYLAHKYNINYLKNYDFVFFFKKIL